MSAQHLRTARNSDHADALLRDRVPFRTRVRLVNRYAEWDPSVALSGTEPCRVAGEWLLKYPEGDCVEASAKTKDFDGDVLEGRVTDFCHTTGNLPPEYHESLASATYVIRSYMTPIAWHVNAPDWTKPKQVRAWIDDEHPGVWVIPQVSYSITTSGHQSSVYWALRGSWRMDHPPALPMKELTIKGALTKVPSGGR